MDRLDIHFDAHTVALLTQLARVEGVSRNTLVRRLVDEGLRSRCLLPAQSPAPATPVPASPPAGARDVASAAPTSGPGTTSRRPSARRMTRLCAPPVVPGGRRVAE